MLLWLIIALVLVSVFSNFNPKHTSVEKVSYSQFLREIKQGSVQSVMVEDDKIIRGVTKNNRSFVTFMPLPDFALLDGFEWTGKATRKLFNAFICKLVPHVFINWGLGIFYASNARRWW